MTHRAREILIWHRTDNPWTPASLAVTHQPQFPTETVEHRG